ncbi:MAG: NAD(P)H-dependent glycerol-3-phosphate dehydrogenase, partial [Pelosinus sp.]|nr:NAD(P)H-dependent glycerol-3-phosphate dehydrogenase [Pelosinus sp.]
MKIAVIGAGSWGTAITSMLAQKNHEVVLWARNDKLIAALTETNENTDYLPGVKLAPNITFTNDLVKAAHKAAIIIITTPSHAVHQTIENLSGALSAEAIIVSAAKGFELSRLKRLSDVIGETLPNHKNRIAVLSGPNHAEEVGLRQPSASVIGAACRSIAEQVQDALMLPYFRVYTNPDIIGVELGGALKNIIALGAGIAEGLSYGDNTKAALMTRGIAEITRLGVAMGAHASTFSGLSGIGDLMVTCTSRHSRNRRAGILLAEGKTMQQIETESKMVVEGIRATVAAHQLAQRYQIEMPITEEIFKVLYENKAPKKAVLDLMTRGRTHEIEE